MKVLCWQFHRDAGRVRDGQNSIQWASCSTELTVRYCMQYQIEYMYSSTPEYWTIYPGAGPGFERFQVFQPQYDTYDFILYLDTDTAESKLLFLFKNVTPYLIIFEVIVAPLAKSRIKKSICFLLIFSLLIISL